MTVLITVMMVMAMADIDTAPVYPDTGELLYYLNDAGGQMPVTSVEEWALRKNHILKNMQKVMGPLPEASREEAPAWAALEETDFPETLRKLIRYESAPGNPVHAFLYLPKNQEGKRPAVLCLHPTSELGKRVVAGEGKRPNRNYAQELAEKGYVVLAPDYPGFGDDVDARAKLYEEGYVSCTMKGIWNHIRAVDLLQSLEEVDGDRIGCIGHSLGGHNTLFVGAFDERIRVLVTSCGFTAFPHYKNGNLKGWAHDGYMPRITTEYKNDPERMPFDFPEVLGALAPRPLFVNAPLHDDNFEPVGVKESIGAAKKVYALFSPERLIEVHYPNAEHDFPNTERQAAYEFLEKHLGSPCPASPDD